MVALSTPRASWVSNLIAAETPTRSRNSRAGRPPMCRIARGDTAELNELASADGADVVAISAGAYPQVADRYLLLPHGASVGRGFGPVVVSKRPMTAAELPGRRVGIPGLSTTAWMV